MQGRSPSLGTKQCLQMIYPIVDNCRLLSPAMLLYLATSNSDITNCLFLSSEPGYLFLLNQTDSQLFVGNELEAGFLLDCPHHG